MKREIAYKLPRLVQGKGENWYVSMSVQHPLTGKLMPYKCTKGFKVLRTKEEKVKHGEALIQDFTKKLAGGWNPWSRGDAVYVDQIAYHQDVKLTGRSKKTAKSVTYFLSDYLTYKKSQLKKKSYESYVSKLRLFNSWLKVNKFGDYDVAALDNRIILKFFNFLIKERELARPTVEKYKVNLSDFFKYLRKKKVVFVNPVYDIVYPSKVVDKSAKPFPRGVLKNILEIIKESDPQLFLACMFIYYCFLRPSYELRFLKIKDLNLDEGLLWVNPSHSKTGRAETIDIPDQLIELCRYVYDLELYNHEFYVFGNGGRPGPNHYGVNTLREKFNRIRDKNGISKDYKFYSMKHTGAGILLESGATISELMSQLRHTELTSTQHYIRRHFGDRNNKVRKNFPSPI
ncbi:MAG: site-specific integrase [Bacteroidales bacterium]|jgi:integrase|nr:site-specific integrase [Bacteroidales bacterium]